MPRRRARSIAAAARVVFPIPGSPPSSTTAPRPAAAAPSRSPINSTSASRPTMAPRPCTPSAYAPVSLGTGRSREHQLHRHHTTGLGQSPRTGRATPGPACSTTTQARPPTSLKATPSPPTTWPPMTRQEPIRQKSGPPELTDLGFLASTSSQQATHAKSAYCTCGRRSPRQVYSLFVTTAGSVPGFHRVGLAA
jgi:hypothetical protein